MMEMERGKEMTKQDITLSNGTIIHHERLHSGAWEAICTDNPQREMTDNEWFEYCALAAKANAELRKRVIAANRNANRAAFEAAKELQHRIKVRKQTGKPMYPFADNLEFCPLHGINSDIIEVAECNNCRVSKIGENQ